MNEMLFSLGLIALLTSMLSAVTGVGGGVLLLSGLTLYLPPQAIVPIHGVIQTWSCGVRLALFWQQIHWRLIPPFLIGMAPGAALGGFILHEISVINPSWMLIFIAIVILSSVVGLRTDQSSEPSIPKRHGLRTLGFICGCLSILAGSTGPLVSTALLKRHIMKEAHVATKAFLQGMTHIIKIPIYAYVLDFEFTQYLPELAVMVTMVIFGTRLGKGLLRFVPVEVFSKGLRLLLILAAMRILLREIPVVWANGVG